MSADLTSVGAKTVAGMSPIGLGVAAAQGALGIAQTVMGSIQQKKWLKQLKAFQTPDEVGKALNLTQSMAQNGYDAFTLNYLNSGVDRAAESSLGAATRLGADPNQLSDILDQRMQGLYKIGAENHNLNMANVNKYLGALEVVAKNKEAEWASQQDIVKQNLQAAAAKLKDGMGNIGGAANNLISMEAAKNTANLYLDKQNLGALEVAAKRAEASSVLTNQIAAQRASRPNVMEELKKAGLLNSTLPQRTPVQLINYQNNP